jgi:putative acetyltransferase
MFGTSETTVTSRPTIRHARDDDARQLIELISSCFAEYPGCVLDVDREEPELRRIASAYTARGGLFWVATREDRLVGSVGLVPAESPTIMELRKLYVARSERRSGLGSKLCVLVEEEARSRGAVALQLWSDTRFADAHRLYERLGYGRGSETRELHDLSQSVEFYFSKALA